MSIIINLKGKRKDKNGQNFVFLTTSSLHDEDKSFIHGECYETFQITRETQTLILFYFYLAVNSYHNNMDSKLLHLKLTLIVVVSTLTLSIIITSPPSSTHTVSPELHNHNPRGKLNVYLILITIRRWC